MNQGPNREGAIRFIVTGAGICVVAFILGWSLGGFHAGKWGPRPSEPFTAPGDSKLAGRPPELVSSVGGATDLHFVPQSSDTQLALAAPGNKAKKSSIETYSAQVLAWADNLRDDAHVKAEKFRLRRSIEETHDAIFRRLALSPDNYETLITLLVEKRYKLMEMASTYAGRPGTDPLERSIPAYLEAIKPIDSDIQNLVGRDAARDLSRAASQAPYVATWQLFQQQLEIAGIGPSEAQSKAALDRLSSGMLMLDSTAAQAALESVLTQAQQAELRAFTTERNLAAGTRGSWKKLQVVLFRGVK